MADNDKQDVLLMAILVLNRDDVMAGAVELGIPAEQVTDELVEQVKDGVAEELGDWREVIQGIVREVISVKIAKCPLGMDCSSSCTWRDIGECPLPRKVRN